MMGRRAYLLAATLIVGSLLALIGANRALAAPGDLDTTFGGGDGKVTTDSGLSESASGLAIQPDGRLVAAGSSSSSTTRNDFTLTRYLSDGTLDPTFDGDGTVTTDFGSNEDGVRAIALQQDGKIVATGSTAPAFAETDDVALARYNADGTLDTSFNGDGKVTTEFSTECSFASDLAIQVSGELVVGGGSCSLEPPGGGGPVFGLARYNTNGSLDTTFGEGGKARIVFGANALALQPDGKIVTLGSSRATGGNFDLNFALARYLVTDSPLPPPPPPNAAPVIKPISPKAGSKTSDTTPLIKARIRDDSGELRASQIKLFVDNKRKPFKYVAGARDLLTASPKLGKGRHTIKIVATDRFGKSAAKSWAFKVAKRR